ncbi:MAG: hypothetical protein K6F56_03445 [Oscillospiraceae bacterium]|nr:hypothetical protein [Oscillospiraceae bacterium]
MNNALSKFVICLSLVLFAVVSFFPLANRYSSPERYAAYNESIDEKTETVLKLMGASTVTSAGLSAIPGDTATPIAEKLADFSEYFLLILCVLYAEKYLLSIIPLGVFRGLIPLVCGLFMVGRFWNPKLLDRQAWKLTLVSIALLAVIPLSIRTSDLIYATYRQSIDSTIASAEELSEETSELSEAEDAGMLRSILNRLSETKDGLTEKASTILNRFVETLAVMIVTSCLIPILVLLFFLWIFKQLTGMDLRELAPQGKTRRPPYRQPHGEDRRETERDPV